MSALVELAERCEKATGPDRALDREIWLAVVADDNHRELVRVGRSLHGDDEANFRIDRLSEGASYTASLDAAMSLVPEGLHLSQFGEARFMTRSPCFSASIEQWVDEHLEARTPFRCHGVAATPALALCAAALRARASADQ